MCIYYKIAVESRKKVTNWNNTSNRNVVYQVKFAIKLIGNFLKNIVPNMFWAKFNSKPRIKQSNTERVLKVLTYDFFFRIGFYTPKHVYKYFSKKETSKNDFENCAEVSPMSDGWDPPCGGHKNNFFQSLRTPLDSISWARSKVLKPFFSNLSIDRTFRQGLCVPQCFPAHLLPSLPMVRVSIITESTEKSPRHGMLTGETERCAEKRKKAGGMLRYALIGAQERH